MSGKEKFKLFVQKNPSLIKYVNNNEMTWQKFYEMYDLYGEESTVWDKYIKTTTPSSSSFDLLNWIKNVDVDTIQENINSVKRVIGVLQDLNVKDDTANSVYKPRPLYKHFED